MNSHQACAATTGLVLPEHKPMKIIKLGNKQKFLLRAECLHCGTIVEECMSKLKWEYDRDGDLARETCPNGECGKQLFFYKENAK